MEAYTPRNVGHLTATPPPPHLIQNVCRENGSILLYGKTGIGKTRLLWQLACGWASGAETFGLKPQRPLNITLVEADMFRSEFESMIKEYITAGLTPPPSLHWFSRDDTTPFFVESSFGKALLKHNVDHDVDLTIYDAVPDIHIGDVNDARTAYQTLRALHSCANGRAYLGVFVQRKGSTLQSDNDKESVDEMLGSQAWGRSASTVWQMTNVPSLVWVKHRLCAKPAPIIFTLDKTGSFSLKSQGSHGIIFDEASRGFTSVNDLAARVQTRADYQALPFAYKDRTLRELITQLVKNGKLTPTVQSGVKSAHIVQDASSASVA